MSRVLIQMQDNSGSWRTLNECENDDTVVRRRLDTAEQSYPNTRLRAIDRDSRSIIDLRN